MAARAKRTRNTKRVPPPHCPQCWQHCTIDGVVEAEHQPCQFRHFYVCQGWSTRRIAEHCGLNRARVSGILRGAGVTLAPRGAGRSRPPKVIEPDDLAEQLRELYLRQRLSSTQIAQRLDMPSRRVRERLAQFGIERRTKGRCNREDRSRLEPTQLLELAVAQDLSATEISAVTHAGYHSVLRDLHATGVAVRLGGPPPESGPERIELIAALYADEQVSAVLDAYDIPAAPHTGPLWERFPKPVPLTEDLVRELYVKCGLSTTDIELVTGQPAQTVLGHLNRYGIPRRTAGGRSPFRRRWRASDTGTPARPDTDSP